MSRKSTVTTILTDAVERQARAIIARCRTASPLWDLIEYHLGWEVPGAPPGHSGKKVRPLLLLMVNQALGGEVSGALPIAAGIELLHNAALVFDDIQDAGVLRRGRQALWRTCGVRQAMNAGVALQAVVHVAAAQAAAAGVAPERAVVAGEELALCTLRLAEGQHQDLTFQDGSRPSIDDYMQMCGGKTASLLASAAYLGAMLAERDDISEAARRLGYHLGMYLQIEDDIAGIWGNPQAMGKVPDDLENRKKTLPLLYIFELEDIPAEAVALGERFFAGETMAPGEFERLRTFARDLGGRCYAEEMAGFHRDLARRALDEVGVGGSELQAVLDEITAALVAAV